MINSFSLLETMWKKGLLQLSRPFDTILAFLGYNFGQIGPNVSNFDPLKTKSQNVMIDIFSVLEMMWKSGLV